MENWEYKIIISDKREKFLEQINQAGAEGWEVVNCAFPLAAIDKYHKALLKRRGEKA